MSRIKASPELLINGSNPSINKGISLEETRNYLIVDNALVPSHGRKLYRELEDTASLAYYSDKLKKVYIFTTNRIYFLSDDGVLETSVEIPESLGIFSVAELVDGSVSFSTGSALYVFSDGTLNRVTANNGLEIIIPNSCVTIDNFVIVSDATRSTFQISKPNQPLDYSNNIIYNFESKAGNIIALAEIDRVLFVIGSSAIERWVVVGSEQIVNRDNVFLSSYGLLYTKSFVNKFNMFVGIFQYKGNTPTPMVMDASGSLHSIASPGISKKIQNGGEPTGSDLYEIDSLIYYEISFESFSFIYCFNNKKWVESDAPFYQVFSLNLIPYALFKNGLYTVSLYNNDLMKRRITSPLILPDFSGFSVSRLNVYYTNIHSSAGNVKSSFSRDSVQFKVENKTKFSSKYYAAVVLQFDQAYQFSLKLETTSNIIWRGLQMEIVNANT